MFQKYKILDANTKHSIFLESIHLQSSNRVLIHKIITSDSSHLKNRLLEESSSNPYSVTISEYYQSDHALFVVLEDAYPIHEAMKNMGANRVAELLLEIQEISKERIKMFHTQLFVQSGRLRVYCLGGVDQNVSCLYNPPESQYRVIGGNDKESGYVWNLGITFYHVLVLEERGREAGGMEKGKEPDYNKNYKGMVLKLESLCKVKSKLESVYHLIRSMVKYPPSERITWSIVAHSLQIIIEQSELQRSHTNSKYTLHDRSHIGGEYEEPTIIKNLLSSTGSSSFSRSKGNRLSFINKAPSPHRRLKPSKSGLDLSTGFPYRIARSRQTTKLQLHKPSLFKPIRLQQSLKQDKGTDAQSFLQLIQNKRKRTKDTHSFLIKNQMVSSLLNESCFLETNKTQTLHDESSISKEYQYSVMNSTQSTKRASFRRNTKQDEEAERDMEKSKENWNQVESLKQFLEKQRKNTQVSMSPIVINSKTPSSNIETKFTSKPTPSPILTKQPIIQQIYPTQLHSKRPSGSSNSPLQEQIQSYSASTNTLPLQPIEIKNSPDKNQNWLQRDSSQKMSLVISADSYNPGNGNNGKSKQTFDEIEEFQSEESYCVEKVVGSEKGSRREEKEGGGEGAGRKKKISIGGALGDWKEGLGEKQKEFERVTKPIQQTKQVKKHKQYIEIAPPRQPSHKNIEKYQSIPLTPPPQLQKTQKIITPKQPLPLPPKQPQSQPQPNSIETSPRNSSSSSTSRMIKAFNLLGQAVKHANINLKAQRTKWMVQCFFVYKCYWSFRMNIASEQKRNKTMDNLDAFNKDNESITLGLNSMYNVVHKVTSTEPMYQENKDLITMSQLQGNWKPRYIKILSGFFTQMTSIVKTERVHLASKGKYKVLLKFSILIGVAVLVIEEYKSESDTYSIVETYKHLSERLSECQEEDLIPESFTQELEHRISRVLKSY